MVRISKALLKEASSGLTNTLSQILVCPLSKQPLRYCEASNSLISDAIGVSFPGHGHLRFPFMRRWHLNQVRGWAAILFTYGIGRYNMKGIKDTLLCGDVIASCFIQRAKDGSCETSTHPTLDGAAMKREWCSVCLSKVMEGEEVRALPCQHEFHKICVERWFHECQKEKTCPICRFSMRDEATEVLTEEMQLRERVQVRKLWCVTFVKVTQ